MTEFYELPAHLIKEIDEITFDIKAIENTLRVALTYHSNRSNELKKKEKEWWKKVVETFKLDTSVEWKTDRRNATFGVIRVEEDDE